MQTDQVQGRNPMMASHGCGRRIIFPTDRNEVKTRRVDRSMKNRTTKRLSPEEVQTSTVKKALAKIGSQWLPRNSSQVIIRLRSGAGSIPCRFRMFAATT